MKVINYYKFILIILLVPVVAYMITCSKSKGTDPPDPVFINNPELYFPAAEGDTWYYTDISEQTFYEIKRVISGDTTVNGITALRVLHNDTTAEAWVVDSTAFYVHLLDKILRFQPPLKIPFNLEKDKPFSFSSTVYMAADSGLYQMETSGTLTFKGDTSYSVPAGSFDSVIDLYYDIAEPEDQYHEYYSKGAGLLYNGVIRLDSAYVGGVWFKQ